MEQHLQGVLNLLNQHIKSLNLTVKLVCMSDGEFVNLFYVAQLGSGDFEQIACKVYSASVDNDKWIKWLNYHINNPKS